MSRSPGARHLAAALLVIASAAAAEGTSDFTTAEDAVAARAWEDAARIWTQEARQGNAEAFMGLGNLWDLGVLGYRDQTIALAFYRKAAEGGLPAAAFNVGAMYASGSGTRKDMAAAATWYARAALSGHDRAAFSLGRLYAEGDALPENARIAAGWLQQAAQSIPAAEEVLAELEAGTEGKLSQPEPLMFQVRQHDGAVRAQAAWSAAAGPDRTMFRVEIMEKDAEGQPGALLASVETRAGFAEIELPDEVDRLLWRVVMVDTVQADYVSSDWHDAQMRPTRSKPVQLVRFQTGAGNEQARSVAEVAADGLSKAGLRVSFASVSDKPAISSVRYRFGADAPLARDIARFLPAISPSNVERDPTLDALPGEIVVLLAFD